jgi:hypothetical protein
MTFGTPSVAIATTPTVISTFFTHIFARRKRSKHAKNGDSSKPEEQLTYEEGLQVIRRFLEFASHHGVEEVQSFTAMPIPVPRESGFPRVGEDTEGCRLDKKESGHHTPGDYQSSRGHTCQTLIYVWPRRISWRWTQANRRGEVVEV